MPNRRLGDPRATQPPPGAARPKASHPPRPPHAACGAPRSSWGHWGRHKLSPPPWRGGGQGRWVVSPGVLSPAGTWRSQLRLAGGAGQGQALPEPVHPVESQGQLRFRHGFQGFGRGKGKFGLIGQARLGALGVPGAPRLEGERRGQRRSRAGCPLGAAVCCSRLSSGARCRDEARVRLSHLQGCSVLDPPLRQRTDAGQTRRRLEAPPSPAPSTHKPFTVPSSLAIARSRFPLQAGSAPRVKASRAPLISPTSDPLDTNPVLAGQCWSQGSRRAPE